MRIGLLLVAGIALHLSAATARAQTVDTPRPIASNSPSIVKKSPAGTDPEILDRSPGIGCDDESSESALPRMGWLRSDYLIWFVRKQTSVPLIETMPDSLATSTTFPAGSRTTLFPRNDRINYNAINGLRLNGGFWFDNNQHFGLDATLFMLEQNSVGGAYSSQGSPILARFYVNANNGNLTSLQFSNPDPAHGYGGSLAANVTLSSIHGGDLNFRCNGYSIFSDNVDWLFGGRYLSVREQLDIGGSANLRDGTSINVRDHFFVNNTFYGAQVGLHSRWANWHGFSLDGIFKFAMGGVNERVTIRGDNAITTPAGVTTAEATGLYARSSNIGVHEKSTFAVLPEITVNLNYNINQSTALFLGYNFLYISDIMRVTSAIDTRVNDSNIRYIANPTMGNAPGPNFAFRDQTMWLQGFNLGMRFEY